jgi:hypothetical protein
VPKRQRKYLQEVLIRASDTHRYAAPVDLGVRHHRTARAGDMHQLGKIRLQ